MKCLDFNQFKPLFDSYLNNPMSGKRNNIRCRKEQAIDTDDFLS